MDKFCHGQVAFHVYLCVHLKLANKSKRSVYVEVNKISVGEEHFREYSLLMQAPKVKIQPWPSVEPGTANTA